MLDVFPATVAKNIDGHAVGPDDEDTVFSRGADETPFRLQAVRILRLWSNKPGKYGETLGFFIKGIYSNDDHVITRTEEWTIERVGPVVGSRTCVNNCTPASTYVNSIPEQFKSEATKPWEKLPP